MIHPTLTLRLIAGIAAMVAAFAAANPALAQKQSVPRQTVVTMTEKPVEAQDNVVQLLLLMKTDKSGNVSKEEFNKLVDAEFDLLAKNPSGVVNVKDLMQSDWHRAMKFTGK
jgi:precorrin-2 methylase